MFSSAAKGLLRRSAASAAVSHTNTTAAAAAAAAAVSAASAMASPPAAGVLSRSFSAGAKMFTYDEVKAAVQEKHAIESVEAAFGMLSKGKVDVPIPMHIGIDETASAGPGDCHIKGGYISGTTTWTVKLANVSFYKNVEKGMAPGSGIFIVCDATNGLPLAVFQENRYMTDLRTGAAGAVCVKHFANAGTHDAVSFVGTGVIAKAMARATANVHGFKEGFAYGLDFDQASAFAAEMTAELGYPITAVPTAEECVSSGDVVFTQTTGASHVLEKDWLKPHATIIASGSDQPTKNEIPPDVQASAKVVCDLVRQCSLVGELRSALAAGVMSKEDVYAELGDVVNGTKAGRKAGDGMGVVLCDLTGTGAQDAAIGQVAWEILGGGK